MSSAKSISEEQIKTIQGWADEGDGLSEIQKRLADEMELKFTYLEMRFLLDDIGVTLKPPPEPEPEPEEETEAEPEEAEVSSTVEGDGAAVTVDKVQRPGAIMSGSVEFAEGKSASWWLDQMGQLGMDPKGDDFQPSPEQMMSFQRELQAKVQGSGM